jgi:hypothetical protein
MSVPPENISNSQGLLFTLAGVGRAIFRGAKPPSSYQWNSDERRQLHQSASSFDTPHAELVDSVNYELDRKSIPINSHSRKAIEDNIERVKRDPNIRHVFWYELATFIQNRNSKGNNYGSCVAGIALHGVALDFVAYAEHLKENPDQI